MYLLIPWLTWCSDTVKLTVNNLSLSHNHSHIQSHQKSLKLCYKVEVSWCGNRHTYIQHKATYDIWMLKIWKSTTIKNTHTHTIYCMLHNKIQTGCQCKTGCHEVSNGQLIIYLWQVYRISVFLHLIMSCTCVNMYQTLIEHEQHGREIQSISGIVYKYRASAA